MKDQNKVIVYIELLKTIRTVIIKNTANKNISLNTKTIADFVQNIKDEKIRSRVTSVTQDLPLILNNLMINRSVWMIALAIILLPIVLVHVLSESHWQNIKDKFTNNGSRLERNMVISTQRTAP